MHLARSALVLATVNGRETRGIRSLKAALDQTKKGKVRLVQPDPSRNFVGLAGLSLEAYAEGAITKVGGKINARALDRLLSWLPKTALMSDLAVPSKMPSAWNVVLISEARCADLMRRGISIRAAYPEEGTLQFDYPVFIPSWVSGEKREAAELFLDFLSSHVKQAGSRLDAKCTTPSQPSTFRSLPDAEVMRQLLAAWRGVAKQ